MNAIISKRFSPVFLFFLFVFLHKTTTAQICDKKTTVYFKSDQFAVSVAEESKLKNLTSQFSQKTDTFLLEIYAFSDSIASAEYNLKLSKNRFKSIVAYLKKNSAAQFKIVEKVRGEAKPLHSNATEEGRAKNRRVEIFYFKLNGDLVTFRGKGGMEMSLSKNYFEPRGICECNPKMMEIFTNEQAARAGINMSTTAGCPLVTAGMISVTFDGMDENNCSDVTIRIPADKYDKDMEVWNSPSLGANMSGWSRESDGQLEYDEKNKIYSISMKWCPGKNINLDKVGRGSGCSDSAGVIAIPELVRSKKRRNYRVFKTTIASPEGEKTFTIAKFLYTGRGRYFFADSGMGKDKVGYYFAGYVAPYIMECDSGRCRRSKECWCFEIPISEYKKIIYFQPKKNYRLKVPRKFKNYSVRLYIPAADTIIPVADASGTRRKYAFQQPLPETYVVLYKEGSDANNKRAYDYHVDLQKIKTRYSKKKKIYKARLKRRQLRHPV